MGPALFSSGPLLSHPPQRGQRPSGWTAESSDPKRVGGPHCRPVARRAGSARVNDLRQNSLITFPEAGPASAVVEAAVCL